MYILGIITGILIAITILLVEVWLYRNKEKLIIEHIRQVPKVKVSTIDPYKEERTLKELQDML